MCVSAVEVRGQACLHSLVFEAARSRGFWVWGQGLVLVRVLVRVLTSLVVVTYMPADNISGSRELSAKPGCDTSMFTILADMYTLALRVIMIIVTLFVLH